MVSVTAIYLFILLFHFIENEHIYLLLNKAVDTKSITSYINHEDEQYNTNKCSTYSLLLLFIVHLNSPLGGESFFVQVLIYE